MSKRLFFNVASLLVNLVVMFGIVLPSLISAANTFLVVCGFVAVPIALYIAYLSTVSIYNDIIINEDEKDHWGR